MAINTLFDIFKLSKIKAAERLDEFFLGAAAAAECTRIPDTAVGRQLLDSALDLLKTREFQHVAIFLQPKVDSPACILLIAGSDADAQSAMSTLYEQNAQAKKCTDASIIWVDPFEKPTLG